ncbi:MAG: hypothetical protein ACI92G_004393 [Candidatus Pelagisphaera sp.]|jgi:hypothetical protein
MTGAIIYTSEDEFDADYKAALYADAKEIAAERQWWKEPLSFFEDPNEPDLLTGSTKLIHRQFKDDLGNNRSIDYRDDMLMGMADYLQVIEILTFYSKEHEFAWLISYPATPLDKPIGRIIDGEIDPQIFDFLIHEMEALDIKDNDLENETLQAEIRAKYFKKDGGPIFLD